MPSALISWNIRRISTLVCESRLPVGSSASSKAGRFTSARAIAIRTAICELAFDFKIVGGNLHHRPAVEALAPLGQLAFPQAPKGLDERETFVGQFLDDRSLFLSQGDELGLLLAVERVQHVVGDAGQEIGIVPHVCGINVAHVLKTEVVRYFAGGQERAGAQIAR